MEIALVGAAYKGRSLLVDCQECINLFPEIEGDTSKEKMILQSTPGLKLFADFSSVNKPNRGIYTTSTGRMFAVCFNGLYEILSSGKTKYIGAIYSISGMCSMSDNGQQLIIVDGDSGYIYDLITGKLQQITADGFPNGTTHVIYLDNRFIAGRPGTDQFFWSHLLFDSSSGAIDLGGLAWDALDFTPADSSPDKIMAITKANGQIWIIGEQSTEVWWDVGGADQPYERINSANIDIGTAARFSVASSGSTIFWLGSNRQGNNTVIMTNGFQPVEISTHAIEYILSTIDYKEDAIGYCYQQEGHAFYVLNFVVGNRTLVYDQATKLWHERSRWNQITSTHQHHRAVSHCLFNGVNHVGDGTNGNIYEYSLDTFTDNGEIIRRDRTSPHIHKDRKRLFHREFEVDIERGVSNAATQDLDASVMLKWSDDGGYTWSNEYTHSVGKQGNYRERVHWHRLGYSRDRVYRLAISDPVKVTIVGAVADIEAER